MNEYIIILLGLALLGLLSGSEAAFLSSSKLVFELDKKNNQTRALVLSGFYKYSGLFQISLSIASLLTSTVVVLYLHYFLNAHLAPICTAPVGLFIAETFLITSALVLFGKIIPSLLFKLKPYLSLSLAAIPLYIISFLLLPLSLISLFLSKLFYRFFGFSGTIQLFDKELGKEDLDNFIRKSIEESSESTQLDTEVKIFQNALEFSSLRLKDCMVPRTEIIALDQSASKDELLSHFIQSGYSKIVIYDGSIDNVVGYIHSAEMFDQPDAWKEKIQSVSIVPETMAANKLMTVLMQEKKSLAVVVDEFGGTSGIVTLEDLVEEIFGDFEDEYDTTTHVAKKISDKEFILSGRMEVDKVNELFEIDIPESDEYQTIAGLILTIHQRFPQYNESVQIDQYLFSVIKKTASKIELVRLKLLDK